MGGRPGLRERRPCQPDSSLTGIHLRPSGLRSLSAVALARRIAGCRSSCGLQHDFALAATPLATCAGPGDTSATVAALPRRRCHTQRCRRGCRRSGAPRRADRSPGSRCSCPHRSRGCRPAGGCVKVAPPLFCSGPSFGLVLSLSPAATQPAGVGALQVVALRPIVLSQLLGVPDATMVFLRWMLVFVAPPAIDIAALRLR